MTITAGLTIGATATTVEAMRGSAFDAGGTADNARAPAVHLESLKAKARAVTATGRTVYEEAARILDGPGKSDFPDEELRAEAVIALRRVARLSYQLAAASEVLAVAIGSTPVDKLTKSMVLGQLLETFDKATGNFDRSSEELLKQIHSVRSREATRESLAEEIARLEVDVPKTKPGQIAISRLQALEREAIEGERVELQALTHSARPYEAAQKTLRAAIFELVPVLAPSLTREAPKPGISLSVYGFFDPQGPEEPGYGLYTYVLLAQGPGTSQRNVAFLRELFASTRRTDNELAAVRNQLNIFHVPARNRIQALVIARSSADAAAAIAAPGVYHYEQAERLLFRLCTESATSNPKLCASAWRGPYLLTFAEGLGASATLPPTRLLVDLSDIHERAFGEFIRAIKEQVMRPNFTDREKVDTLRLRLLDITLKAADWLDPIKEGIAEIVFLDGDTAK